MRDVKKSIVCPECHVVSQKNFVRTDYRAKRMIEFELGRTVTNHDVQSVDICHVEAGDPNKSHISVKFFLNHKDIGYLRFRKNSDAHLGKLSEKKDQNRVKVVKVLQSMQAATKEYSLFVKMLQSKRNHLNTAYKDMGAKLMRMNQNFGVKYDREFARLELDLNEIVEDEADSLIYTYHKIQKFKVRLLGCCASIGCSGKSFVILGSI